ncbi:hypothetical protein SAMN03159358_3656 [Paenibacillus sp. NFR01]|nr:hypothetical protein SAMN03159358_3656 [Paenibacillus sp. NFR01]
MQNNRRFKWVKGLGVAVFIALLIFVYVGNIGLMREGLSQDSGSSTLGELVEGTELEQSFQIDRNNLSGVSIKMATFMRKNEGDFIIALRHEGSSANIYEAKVQFDSITDNAYFDFRFPPIKFSKGKHYVVAIKSLSGEKDASISSYVSDGNVYDGGELRLNGTTLNGDLVFKVYYNRTLFDYLYSKVGG